MSACDRDEDLSGRTVLNERFRLIERLGSGGFGAVYRAEEYALDRALRTVALKLTHDRRLRPAAARERLRDGFVLSRVIARCRNSEARRHLIHVHELGIADDVDGRAYMVMEYVSGVPLMRHIQSFAGGIPMATARRYLRELCTAVSACHEIDPPITHGDLKPDNILVDRCRTIRILDFGLAKPIDRLAGYVTDPGGCLQYTAPEKLLGTGYPASDVYSLGLVMYEVLTGTAPHMEALSSDTRDPATHYYEQKMKLRLPPIAERSTSVDRDLDLFRIVERCCRFHREERYQSVREILDEMEGGAAPEDDATGPRERFETRPRAEDRDGAATGPEPKEDPDGRTRRARSCIALAKAGRWGEALELGGAVFEEGRRAPELPAELRGQVLRALIRCARESGDDDLLAYYESQVGREDG